MRRKLSNIDTDTNENPANVLTLYHSKQKFFCVPVFEFTSISPFSLYIYNLIKAFKCTLHTVAPISLVRNRLNN